MRVQGNFLFAIIAEIEAGSLVRASVPLVGAAAASVVGSQDIAAMRLTVRARCHATAGVLPFLAGQPAILSLQAGLGNRNAGQVRVATARQPIRALALDRSTKLLTGMPLR